MGFLAFSLLAAIAMLLASVLVPSVSNAQAATTADAQGCGYGEGGPSAETICWLDMSNFNATEATSAAGQEMSITLPGGYTASFTVKLSAGADQGPRSVVASAFPTFGGAVMGNGYYKNTPGKPALWTPDAAEGEDWNGWVDHIAISDFSVKDASGAKVTSYSLVAADAESTDGAGGGKNAEALKFTSDKPLQSLFNAQPAGWQQACAGGLTGIGTTSVLCEGKVGDEATNAGSAVLYAQSPTSIAADIKVAANSREAVAFGLQFSSVSITKNIASRYSANDQFTVSTQTADGKEIASATTSGTATSATTGASTLVSPVDGQQVVFKESPVSGTDSSRYTAKWECDKNGTAMPESDYQVSADGQSATAKVGSGEFVACTVSNTAKLGTVNWQKVGDEGTSLLAGSEWSLTGPDGYAKTIIDNGENDANANAGELAASGLVWGEYTLTETKAPNDYFVDSTPHKFQVTSDDLTLNLGKIVNKEMTPGLKVVKTSDPASGSTVKPGQTVTYNVKATNTGNTDLDPAAISDDLSGVFDNATYVENSAKSTTGNAPVVNVSKKSLTWSGKLSKGESVTLTYQVKMNDQAADGAKIANVVVASGTNPDNPDTPVPSNCTTETAGKDADCNTTNTVVNPPSGPDVHTGGSVAKSDNSGYIAAGVIAAAALAGIAVALVMMLKRRSANRR